MDANNVHLLTMLSNWRVIYVDNDKCTKIDGKIEYM